MIRSQTRAFPFVCLLLGVTLAHQAFALDLAAAARSTLGADQGVYVETSDGTVLLSQAADRAVHPASISKIPTTLALLRRLGPEHRFATTFSSAGRIESGVLRGDLIVDGGGDPFLVDENALLVALQLRSLGIERVDGTLRARGALTFNWEPATADARLRAALAGSVPAPAWQAVRANLGGGGLLSASAAAPPALRFGTVATSTTASSSQPLLVHRSQPLLSMVKALNDYSNNIFKPLADAAGGVTAVEQLARQTLPQAMRAEVTLRDGAGTDRRNRMSPRATVHLLRTLEADLAATGHALTDVLPVAGIDDGTLRRRLNKPGESGHVVGKTGTYGDYGACALVGAVRSARFGTVYFAILNRGIPILPARQKQDAFVRALLASIDSQPWDYQRNDAPAFTRAQLVPAAR